MKIRRSIIVLFSIVYMLSGSVLFAQETMKIRKTDNSIITIQTSEIRDITFEKGNISASGSTVTDVDGNVYKTVNIGNQVWMAENLKTTKLRDGTAIANITGDDAWKTLTTPAYCLYDNESSNKTTYGALYNWFCVQSNKICPSGWHIPTSAEFETLGKYLGGRPEAGGKLKEAGTANWFPPNTEGNNSSGFTGLPAGFRMVHGPFASIGKLTHIWSSTPYRGYDSYSYKLEYNMKELGITSNTANVHGMSIRCIKD